jgi:UDP-3-O-[3-hydroxymyristoyl] glucosamine N-acyltransferase
MYELGRLAEFVGGRVIGNPNTRIKGIAGFFDAGPGDITFVSGEYVNELGKCRAEAVIVSTDIDSVETAIPLILVDNPKYAFAQILSLFAPPTHHYEGIHPSVVVGKGFRFGEDVTIGPCVVIGQDVSIGQKTMVFPGVYIGDRVRIGKDCIIYPNVVIREDCVIGDRVIIGAGTVIGSDGFGFVKVNGVHEKIPHIGSVLIEDDVELGANVCVDRATTEVTRVGKGSKVDNLIQIGHNVQIGKNVIIVALAGIAGSAVIGDNVIIAGQSGIVDHCHVGENVIVMARSLVSKDVPDGSVISGEPATLHRENMKFLASLHKVPDLIKTVKQMQSRLEELETMLDVDKQKE